MSVRKTSAETYRAIKAEGLLSKRRMQVYEFIYKNGPCTLKQICKALVTNHNQSSFPGRVTELTQMGAVVDVGETTCEDTGRKVTLWQTTNKIPVPYSGKKSNKQIIKELTERLYDAESVLKKCNNQYKRNREGKYFFGVYTFIDEYFARYKNDRN